MTVLFAAVVAKNKETCKRIAYYNIKNNIKRHYRTDYRRGKCGQWKGRIMQVEWRVERIFKADAQKVYEEIGEKEITPQEVLEKAKDKNTELHKCFEWNDGIAAEKYRLIQARKIILNLVIVQKDKEQPPLRTFHITTEKGVYQPATFFMKQEDEYASLLKRALSELEAFKRKYRTLSELEEVFNAIEAL